jgi:hypothetical protein
MQDLQRVATSRFGKELYAEIEDFARLSRLPHILPSDSMLRAMMSAEDVARRAFSWAPQRHGVPNVLNAWHQAFQREVSNLVSAWTAVEITAFAKRILRPELVAGKLHITWVIREASPGYAYALNRYLALLILEIARRPFASKNPIVERPSHTIQSIAPVGHSCVAAATCSGQPHDVTLLPVIGGTPASLTDVDLIIVRHGVEPRPALLSGPPIREQMVPYELPS